MSRFSWRQAALLSAPAMALLALPLLMRPRQPQSGFQVVAAQTAVPSPASVHAGANVAARLKLDELPNDNQRITWKVKLRMVAGSHQLWDDTTGDIERPVSKRSRKFDGAWYEWNGAFDLNPVPTSWGEVALLWDAQLIHTRTRWLRTYDEVSRQQGRIVLRQAGQNLPPPQVSRQSHLRLLKVEIGPGKMTKVGVLTYPIHPIKLFFERDTVARKSAPRITCDYKVRPHEGFMGFSSINGSQEVNRMDQDYGSNKATARRYPIVEHTIELQKPGRLPGKSFVDWTIWHGDYWPMQVSIPFSDAKGRVLVGTQKLP